MNKPTEKQKVYIACGLCVLMAAAAFYLHWRAWELREQAYFLRTTGVSCQST